jgi:hypothetical protein
MNTPDDFARARKAVNVKIGFAIHLAAYLAVNALLVAINLATSTECLWCKWPLLGWGLGLLVHALVTFALTRSPGIRARLIDREMQKRA